MSSLAESRRSSPLLSLPYCIAGAAMLVTAGVALVMTPKTTDVAGNAVALERRVPAQFGDWREVRSPFIQMDLAPRRDDGTTDPSSPYDEVVMRSYVRASDGAVVMLALAWGAQQRQEVKIHRPELCYVAQGFDVARREHAILSLPGGQTVTTTRLLATSQSRVEPVTYWIRIGEEISLSPWQSRLAILREGLKGRTADGILVRVSQALPAGRADVERSYRIQQEFLSDLVRSVEEPARSVLTSGPVGSPKAP